MRNKIMPPSRPHRNKEKLEAALEHYKLKLDKPYLIFIRGHYLDSLGKKGTNDINMYDDAVYLISPRIVDSWNANTDPSFVNKNGRDLAMLNLGQYKFYKGKHRGRYYALRTFPEGKELYCTRNGKVSTCSHINIHRGGMNMSDAGVTWSEGCLTIPSMQWTDFITRVYAEMANVKLKVIDALLLENRQTPEGQRWFDGFGIIT